MSAKWITLEAKSGLESDLKTCLDELRVASSRESGCIEYRVFQEGTTFYVLERYESSDALAVHKSSDHFTKAKAAFSTLVESKGSQELEELN